ncbi:MAG: 3-hydroxybutyryl-CoA dehydrogenase, partial [Myxococcales bacterium]|nr:3-hydroxybutyryl-CoA dehydrogenase [Myxococcales bacterium]
MKLEDIRAIGVVGAGQMGRGIAQVAAAAGYDVFLCDIDRDTAAAGRGRIEKGLSRLVDKGKVTAEEAAAVMGRIQPQGDVSCLAEAQLAVEAATENVVLKEKIFKSIDDALPEGAIAASNTSSISITRLAATTSRPSLVMGMHFMNPVPVM